MVHQAPGTLPDAFREVWSCGELEDLSCKEIALVVGIPIGTVMPRLSRARGLLAQAILRRGQKAT
ncbi:RNA polymerase sigma factor (fragment) [Thiomonas sp. X19]|uniref:sigma factor-like helix-turn-helix DNA-binding protein n=1 Tax=Thiomonas sp. X19 TaxID=1050370 RepID=UPI000B6C8CCC